MSGIFLKLLNLSISASWLVLVVLALRLVLKRAPKWVNVLLWGMVALRLMLPFSIESALSLIPSAETVSPEVVQFDPAPTITSSVEFIDNAVNPSLSESFAAAPSASANPLYVWTYLAGWVWLIGLAAMLAYALVSYLRLRRRVSASIPLRENIYVCDEVPSPFILGIVHPRIYLPSALDEAQRGSVLSHERAHLARRDHWWKPLGFALLAVYWFNPLLWLAYTLLCRDIELACDERVLKNLDPGSRVSYGRALLSLVAPKRARGQLLSCATTMQLGRKSLRERITLIAKKPKMAAYTLVFVLVLSLVLTACTFTGAPAQPEPEPVPEPVQTEPEPVQPEEPPADTEAPQPVEDDPEAEFQMAFPMLNYASFQRYLDEHPETLDSGWEHIRINEAGFDDAGTSIETQQGDQVLAVDAEYGIVLVRITGDGYRGVLAICRYPELLRLEMASTYGTEGELAGKIASDHGGILAMNANGFQDPNGKGNGGQLAGWCMAQGEEHGYHFGGDVYQRIELSENGLDCRIVPASDPVGEGTYNAAEFTPALIKDGEKLEDSFWTGEQPRACFGAGDQGIYMLVIEGRYPDEGIRGTSVNTCADILLAYGCRNAINMDGGSSAILWYDGEYVTQSSSVTLRYTGGRPLPNAWVYG